MLKKIQIPDFLKNSGIYKSGYYSISAALLEHNRGKIFYE
jgi:hypothetical protein